jgi:CRISPR-associated protein (TIGR02584 family)
MNPKAPKPPKAPKSQGASPLAKTAKKRLEKTSPPPPADDREILLLAVAGISPAVITETVWALAFPPKGHPPAIPHRVRIITTTIGAVHIDKLRAPAPCFGGLSPWEALRHAILQRFPLFHDRLHLEPAIILAKPSPRGIHRELDDIRTPEDNEAAADRILEIVRSITTRNDQRLIASIAGGRKTLGALLYAAMNLVARDDDLLTHVLVSEPFETPLDPPFWFPSEPPILHRRRDQHGAIVQEISSAEARIDLAPVPFVPLRNRFRDLPGHQQVGGFMRLVRELSGALTHDAARPRLIRFPSDGRTLEIDGHTVQMENADQVRLLRWLCHSQGESWIKDGPIKGGADEHFLEAHGGEISKSHSDIAALITRTLSELRQRSRRAGVPWAPDARQLTLPPFRIIE